MNFQDSLNGLTPVLRRRFGKNILNFQCKLLNIHDINLYRGMGRNLLSRPILLIMGTSAPSKLALASLVSSHHMGTSLTREAQAAPCIEFCACQATKQVKRKQRVGRPLGEMPPLSDRAPRDSGDTGRSSLLFQVKTTPPRQWSEWLPRGQRARHVDTANVGTWEIQTGVQS